MHLKSLFPEIPPTPEMNAHHLLLNRPDQKQWKDYTLQIDGYTGEQRSLREFIRRVHLGMSALGAPLADGGLGLTPTDGEMIGIMSPNCLVRCIAFSIPWIVSNLAL
jgi:hypothetical protein